MMSSQSIYRAVVKRGMDSWWLGVETAKGSLITMKLHREAHGGAVTQVSLPAPIAAAVQPLLDRATPVAEAPGLDVWDAPSGSDRVPVDVIASLLELCWPEFVEDDGCIFRVSPREEVSKVTRLPDRTGAEAFVNHVHLNDWFADDEGRCTYQLTDQQCLQIAEMWMTKLRLRFPRRYFAMYLVMDGEDSHLRFHTLRSSEPLWLNPVRMIEKGWDESVTVWFF